MFYTPTTVVCFESKSALSIVYGAIKMLLLYIELCQTMPLCGLTHLNHFLNTANFVQSLCLGQAKTT